MPAPPAGSAPLPQGPLLQDQQILQQPAPLWQRQVTQERRPAATMYHRLAVLMTGLCPLTRMCIRSDFRPVAPARFYLEVAEISSHFCCHVGLWGSFRSIARLTVSVTLLQKDLLHYAGHMYKLKQCATGLEYGGRSGRAFHRH